MSHGRLKLVTVIAEGFLESQIIRELKELGIKGYTITQVKGEGSRGLRASEVEGASVKIETLVTAAQAERVITHVSSQYFEHYSVIVYSHDVDVVRAEKF